MISSIFDLEQFQSNSFICLDPQGSIICPQGCGPILNASNEDGSLSIDDKRILWNHMQETHPTEFQNLLQKHSATTYTPQEEKVSINFIFLK